MKLFRILALWCFILFGSLGMQQVYAQAPEAESAVTTATAEPQVEMADTLRQDGKIYVVVVVLLTILAGLIVYLVALDRKVGKLEKQMRD
ncbi:CcmD family protein [Pontibacter sp. MBLB2868]|uniref:CcmD family protein n=1 Tax=Pontibacter sp. MBLB2868 TaxID=3451555 RepID=UPI003F7539AB